MTLSAWAVIGAARLPVTIPVDPDATTAQRWATEELADPVYHQRPSLLNRIIEWLSEQLSGVTATGLPSPVVLLLVVAVIAAVVAVAFIVNGPVRRSRRVASERSVLDADDVRTSDQIRRAADAAAGAEDWTLAVVERFRAIVRGLEERTVLDERAARTAHEAADAAAGRLPELGSDLVTAGYLFDAVAYGHEAASAADDHRLRDLDTRVRAARPVARARTASDAVGVSS
ncbi:DUF4129 domain-containing protein [Cellulomonas sp. URHE0023]|uniref:DUF4129 domain-containing protein n=1 Tax=Cellulomonas sp. URHE0023 TaxID=1380354 RepID=UPI000B2FF097|nr:DUF4129 domain-containing protein [Cellulomonas sp. URHE0023]